MRIIIAGGPKTGKTALSGVLSTRYGITDVRHTDSLREGRTWEAIVDQVSHWYDDEGPWIIEGVVTPHALVQWFTRNNFEKPADVVLFLEKGMEHRTPKQLSLAKGCMTVWKHVLPHLRMAECEVGDETWAASAQS